MPCFHPIIGYRQLLPNENGKFPLLFTRPKDGMYEIQKIACGQCIGCRLERSRVWAVRCEHEARMYGDNNMFLTLTFNSDQNVEYTNNLVPKVFVDFMKRFREKCGKLRFFHCGEYGSKGGRPHHHAIIFGYRFPDLRLVLRTGSGSNVYRSKMLEDLWEFGFSSVGDVTFESCAYVARYIMKKQLGPNADYKGKYPEYLTMSRRPGIGKTFFDKYEEDIYSDDSIVIRNGIHCRPPRFYDDLFSSNHGEEALIKIKNKRKEKASDKDHKDFEDFLQCRKVAVSSALERIKKNSPTEYERIKTIATYSHGKTKLEQSEDIALSKLKTLHRSLEDETRDYKELK